LKVGNCALYEDISSYRTRRFITLVFAFGPCPQPFQDCLLLTFSMLRTEIYVFFASRLGVCYNSNLYQDILFFVNALRRPPLWSSGQNFWLQIQRSLVRFPALPDFLRSSGFGTGPLRLVRVTEELLGRKSSGSGLENRD
jgi:hypothetical protein